MQFNYCPLVSMFHAKGLSNPINSLPEKVLRVTYQDTNSSFSELLNPDKLLSIYYRNIKYLLIEIYKISVSPPIMSDIFSLGENSFYNLRFGVTMNRRNIGTSKLVLKMLVQSKNPLEYLTSWIKKCREFGHF